jgi:hypothetical protein
MFTLLTAAGAAVQAFVGKLIVIALMIALLAATIFWTRNNPESFQGLVDAAGDAAVSVVTWSCDWVVDKTDGRAST